MSLIATTLQSSSVTVVDIIQSKSAQASLSSFWISDDSWLSNWLI
jgi:hypothetical protein